MADGDPSRNSAGSSSGLKLEVDVVRQSEAWVGVAPTDATLKRAARAAFVAAAPGMLGTRAVTLLLTDDKEMQELNRTWRGKDTSTNVLSFPVGDEASEPALLGDIALAHETILKEAREENIAFSDHVSHLVIHGLLHLLGFDHLNDAEAKRMEDLERRVLASLGIADPYADKGARPVEVSP